MTTPRWRQTNSAQDGSSHPDTGEIADHLGSGATPVTVTVTVTTQMGLAATLRVDLIRCGVSSLSFKLLWIKSVYTKNYSASTISILPLTIAAPSLIQRVIVLKMHYN